MQDRKDVILRRWTQKVSEYLWPFTKRPPEPRPPAPVSANEPEVPEPQAKTPSHLDTLLEGLGLTDLKDSEDGALYRLLWDSSGTNLLKAQVSCLLSAVQLATTLDRCKVESRDLAQRIAFLASQLLYTVEVPEGDGPTRCKMHDKAAQNLCSYLGTKVQGFKLVAVAHGEFIDPTSMDPLHQTREGEKYGISVEAGDMRKKVIPRSCYVLDSAQNVRIKAFVEKVT